MTAPADLLLTNAEVHTLARPDETHDAVAVRDGRITRVGDAYELDFLAGVDTRIVDCDGRVVLPGFIDAHTHFELLGRKLVHADLSGAESRVAAIDRLRDRADAVPAGDPVVGYGYDETEWGESDYLTRADLDAVDAAGPVVAVREDLHVASLDSTAVERFVDDLSEAGVRREGGEPTGVVVEGAAGAVLDALAPDAEGTAELLRAAQRYANERGVTGVHDMVRRSHAPRVYRDLDAADELTLRVRLNYWADHLDALVETGLRTNHGDGRVRVGAIKTFTDGSLGGRTAKLSEPYADAPDERGEWTVPPAEFRDLLDSAAGAGFQVAAHAIGDEAVGDVVDAFATRPSTDARHRVEHAELASDAAIDRMAEADIVASIQPNFHRWAGEDGLYAARIGDRRTETNRLGRLADAGVHLAFGSDGMPLDPLVGVHHAVNAPTADQRLGVTEALRAYTLGSAYAGFDEDRLGTVEPGKYADLVVLDGSPWERPGEIREIDVTLTVVDGEVVYDGSDP
ncbi:amidohydrolase [Haloplanus rubicundus]|uniref:Amidohydrolase n=1 Tax=Haloplanus rubicundus TaxID=1547898 RepID=A0A345DYS9_9EURY|nr:amidohydrolase [Haloplanus rubicundus]AXG05101.1 amidohydrolase [Haloplanus rubicundus]